MRAPSFLQPPFLGVKPLHRIPSTATAAPIPTTVRLCHSAPSTQANLSLLHHLSHTRTLTRTIWQTALTHTSSLVAIDATAGRGSDTLTLAQLLPHDGTVHSIDIQASALSETRQRYHQKAAATPLAALQPHHMSHDRLDTLQLQPRSVGVVAYNLGWCPSYNADRSIVTLGETTVKSLDQAAGLVCVGGVITVMIYVGHDQGKREEQQVLAWAASLAHDWGVFTLAYPNRSLAPRVLICERRQG